MLGNALSTGSSERVPDGSWLKWCTDPMDVALRESSRQRLDDGSHGTDDPFCAEVGRRMLLTQFTYSEWILRRVEKVHFVHDRTVSRTSTIELRVPDCAPVLVGETGDYWLVPITVMSRRTLVNLDLRDEEGSRISLLGLRFTQRLDQAMLRAAALLFARRHGYTIPTTLHDIIRDAVAGDRDQVQAARELVDEVRSGPDSLVKRFLSDDVFGAALQRLWSNFTVYVTLPVDRGRHRMLRMAFEEPTDWVYQRARLKPLGGDRTRYEYRPFAKEWHLVHFRRPIRWVLQVAALLGMTATRVRFLVPSAENCASYHFEFTAPEGVEVSRAVLIAGRPNEPRVGVESALPTVDAVDGRGPTVGLHATEVPTGSLCRAQVELRVARRGWLGTLLLSCLAAFLVTVSVAVHAWRMRHPGAPAWGKDEVTNIVVLLITVSGAAATYVAQREAKGVAARLVAWLRILGAMAISIPALTAAWLVYLGDRVQSKDLGRLADGIVYLAVADLILFLVVMVAWIMALLDEHDSGPISPWDMRGMGAPRAPTQRRDGSSRRPSPSARSEETKPSFHDALEKHDFSRMAVGVHSSEGWHELYAWDDERQRHAKRVLAGRPGDTANLTGCCCGQVVDHEPVRTGGAPVDAGAVRSDGGPVTVGRQGRAGS